MATDNHSRGGGRKTGRGGAAEGGEEDWEGGAAEGGRKTGRGEQRKGEQRRGERLNFCGWSTVGFTKLSPYRSGYHDDIVTVIAGQKRR